MKALIIEDNEEIVEAISILLRVKWPGTTIYSASEGMRGIEIAKAEALDFIILDINLPDVLGFEVLKRIRLFSQVPVIISSARNSEEDRAKGFQSGANDYIVKPFNNREFMAKLNNLVHHSDRQIEKIGDANFRQ